MCTCEETAQEKWGKMLERTKQDGQQSSHLTGNRAPTSQTGVPHNTRTLGGVLEGHYLSTREISPWTKDCSVPTFKKA